MTPEENEDKLLRSVALQNAESIRITRQRAEEQTEATVWEQALLLNLTHDAIFVRDIRGSIKYWNRAAQELYGWRAEETIGKISYDVLQTIYPTPLEEIEAEVMRTDRWEGELIRTKKDGTQIVVASRWSLGPYKQDAPIAILETNNDITRRKRAEEELHAAYSNLQQRESRIRRLVDAQIIGIFIGNLQGEILEANDAFLKIVGYGRDDLLSGLVRWTDLTPLEWRDRDQQAIAELTATEVIQPYEKEYFRKDGSRVPVLIGAAVFARGGNEGVVFVLDLTERKHAEEERERLRQAQAELAYMSRVSMMGELAASLAHEIKQPITAAVLRARTGLRWLQRQPPDIEKAREILSRIIEDASRAATIVDRNRSLYKRETSKRETVNLNEVIRETIALLQEKASKNSILIRTQLDAVLPTTSADRVQVQQVLMNLILNGIEAMKEARGELTITSETGEHSQVLISVRDSGVGLPVGNPERIFEAFFTTKPEGTGMGLSISRRIIESHGGRLWASANPGGGAIFHFALPGTAVVKN
jgi:PAS domain S-box-containing protein